MEQREESTFIQHLPCGNCGSSDANSLYSDGHQFCFACEAYVHGDGESKQVEQKRDRGLITGEYQALSKRRLTEETCRKFGYQIADFKGKKVHVAPYYDVTGTIVAQKVRFPDKEFTVLGNLKQAGLFGSQLWSSGKKIVVTEGEVDCLSVSQVQGNKWPVVSIPNGAQGAKKSLQKSLEYLSAFEEVILMFDQDEEGIKAMASCAELFEPGKVKIARLPLKDASECLQKGREQDIISAIWNAKPYRPDGVIDGSELWESITKEETVVSLEYPWKALTEITRGMRKGELVTLTAGSGIGKSAIVREIAYNLLDRGETVGMLMLEENPKRTALGLMGIHLNKPIHINKSGVTNEDLEDAFKHTVGSGNCYLYNHFGSTAIENLLARIRYLARGCGCSWIILDHLSIVVSGLGDGDERRLIDNAMTHLRTLVEETGVGMFLVSHLRRPEGDKGHEQGAKTSLSQLRGSHSIAQLSDIVIGLERNQQGDNPNTTTLRVLKNRFTGETGVAGYLFYDRDTGRLSEVDEPGEGFKDETRGEY